MSPGNDEICSALAHHFLSGLVPGGWRLLNLDGHTFIRIAGSYDFEVRLKRNEGPACYVLVRFAGAMVDMAWKNPAGFVLAFSECCRESTRRVDHEQ